MAYIESMKLKNKITHFHVCEKILFGWIKRILFYKIYALP